MVIEHVKLSLVIDTANDAVIEDPSVEVARMLRAAAEQIENSGNHCAQAKLRDYNGNTVGSFNFYSEV